MVRLSFSTRELSVESLFALVCLWCAALGAWIVNALKVKKVCNKKKIKAMKNWEIIFCLFLLEI